MRYVFRIVWTYDVARLIDSGYLGHDPTAGRVEADGVRVLVQYIPRLATHLLG